MRSRIQEKCFAAHGEGEYYFRAVSRRVTHLVGFNVWTGLAEMSTSCTYPPKIPARRGPYHILSLLPIPASQRPLGAVLAETGAAQPFSTLTGVSAAEEHRRNPTQPPSHTGKLWREPWSPPPPPPLSEERQPGSPATLETASGPHVFFSYNPGKGKKKQEALSTRSLPCLLAALPRRALAKHFNPAFSQRLAFMQPALRVFSRSAHENHTRRR